MTNSPVVIAAAMKHTATIIFLHGLGDTGDGWSNELEAIREPYMKIICPTANTIPVTLNGGAKMPSWFDLHGLDSKSIKDVDGIKSAASYVHDLIEKEISEGIPSDRILVGGFSQGGCLALYAALTYPKKLAGVLALSCWMPLSDSFSPSMVTGNKDVSILQCHGDRDNIVLYKYGQTTASFLNQFSKNVEFKTYAGLMHSTSDREMEDIKNFLKNRLPTVE